MLSRLHDSWRSASLKISFARTVCTVSIVEVLSFVIELLPAEQNWRVVNRLGQNHTVSLVFTYLSCLYSDTAVETKDTYAELLIVYSCWVVQSHGAEVLYLTQTHCLEPRAVIFLIFLLICFKRRERIARGLAFHLVVIGAIWAGRFHRFFLCKRWPSG